MQFYPPGVLFIATSLGLVALATVRHDLLTDPLELAATIAHEMRTPLATIRSQSRGLSNSLPELLAGYQSAVDHGLLAPTLRADKLAYLADLAQLIDVEVSRSNFVVDLVLASARAGMLNRQDFALHSVKKCVDEALARYPFEGAMRDKVRVRIDNDFTFYGSDVLLVYVLYTAFDGQILCESKGGRYTMFSLQFSSDSAAPNR